MQRAAATARLIRMLFSVLPALAATHARAQDAAAPPDQMEIQGPWAYSNNSKTQGDTAPRLAITRAGESSDVWFGFTCAKDLRIFASVLDQSGSFASVNDEISVDIELPNVTRLNSSAKKASDTVMAFNPELSQKLFIYAIHEKALQITFSNPNSGPHTYTFQLQPNRDAFQGIVDACLPQHPGRDL